MSKKTNPQIDFKDLTINQLKKIRDEADSFIAENEKNAAKENLKNLKNNGQLDELKKEYKSINELKKELCQTHKITLNIPVEFSVAIDMDKTYDGEYEWLTFPHDYLQTDFSGKVVGDSLNKKQKIFLNDTLQNILDDACSETLALFPEQEKMLENLKTCGTNLADKLDKYDISLKDLPK